MRSQSSRKLHNVSRLPEAGDAKAASTRAGVPADPPDQAPCLLHPDLLQLRIVSELLHAQCLAAIGETEAGVPGKCEGLPASLSALRVPAVSAGPVYMTDVVWGCTKHPMKPVCSAAHSRCWGQRLVCSSTLEGPTWLQSTQTVLVVSPDSLGVLEVPCRHTNDLLLCHAALLTPRVWKTDAGQEWTFPAWPKKAMTSLGVVAALGLHTP